MTKKQFKKLWNRVQKATIATYMGAPLSSGVRRRARKAELQLRAYEHKTLAELDWQHRLFLNQGTISFTDCPPFSREWFYHWHYV